MEDFVLTAHAELVMSERGIERDWVARVLGNPQLVEADRADPELTHHLGRIAEHEGLSTSDVTPATHSPNVSNLQPVRARPW